jgi:4-diphosphocytidyl-2-C-methyl-D-erythritol kinase
MTNDARLNKNCSLPLKIPAFAKINLSLRVLGRRKDGFHNICTTLQTISLCDFLTFQPSDEIVLTADVPEIPVDEKNLIVQAAKALRERFDIKSGAKICLEKRIPAPGGLGGGSSNAAITLLALTRLWQIETTRAELAKIGETLGADVPFFLFGGTTFATGLGTEIEMLPDLPRQNLLIITPKISVSTAAAYRSLDAPRLTERDELAILTICRSARILDCESRKNWVNDFENTIFALEPEIARVKKFLLDAGADLALMSGSGASVFGIFDNLAARAQVLKELRRKQMNWRIFECETVSRAEYAKTLAPCWN